MLQIRQLFKLVLPRDILDRLGKLPRDLRKAYDEIYREIQNQEGSAPQVADRAFRWVLCSQGSRSLFSSKNSKKLLTAAVCQDPDSNATYPVDVDIEFILDACQNLLVYNAEIDEFRFAHLSVREYLEDNGATKELCHAFIGKVCLNILMDPVLQVIRDGDLSRLLREGPYSDLRIALYNEELVKMGNEDQNAKKEYSCSTGNSGGNTVTKFECKGCANAEAWACKAEAKGGFNFLYSIGELVKYARALWVFHLKKAGYDGINKIQTAEGLLQDFLGDFERTTRSFEHWWETTSLKTDYSNDLLRRMTWWPHVDRVLEAFSTYEGKCGFAICLLGLDQITEKQWTQWPLSGDLQSPNGDTLFQVIAATNSVVMAQHLFKTGQACNSATTIAVLSTALLVASENGHHEMVRLLLDNGADVNNYNDVFGNPLAAAASKGYIDIVEFLLDRGADVNASRSSYGCVIRAATYHRRIDMVKLLLDRGADVNAYGDNYGGYALHTAASWGRIDIMRLLLDQGADVNARGGQHVYAFHTAAACRNIDIMRLLLDRGADVNARGGQYGYALQAAAYHSNIGVVRLLLDRGADVNTCGGHFEYALQAAAFCGNFDITRLLLDRGAEINTQDSRYGHALQAAASGGHIRIVRLLLDRGAEINACSGIDGYALHAAAHSSRIDTVRLLLDRGARVNDCGGNFGYALQAAAAIPKSTTDGGLFDKADTVRLLLDQGADVNAHGGEYGCALQAAVYCGFIDIVKLLLERGADVNFRGGKFMTCLNAAKMSWFPDDLKDEKIKLIELLLEHGAVDEPYATDGYASSNDDTTEDSESLNDADDVSKSLAAIESQ